MWPTGSTEQGINALAVVSLIASITSLVGFVTTTYLGWREDKREARDASLEQVRKELEIEKLRLELKRMKAHENERQASD